MQLQCDSAAGAGSAFLAIEGNVLPPPTETVALMEM